MDLVIPPHHVTSFVYLDDLLLVSDSFDRHMKLLIEVSQLLRDAGLTVNVAKCKFFIREVNYLGYVIGNGVIKTDPSKVSAILDVKPPRVFD